MKLPLPVRTGQRPNGVVLSRPITYAVQATIAIANRRTGRPVSARDLANAGHLPERFLPQILRKLVNKGVLHSSRGVAGGYALSRAPSQITLWDIVDAIEERNEMKQLSVPGLSDAACERLTSSLTSTAAAVQESLERLTVAELISADS